MIKTRNELFAAMIAKIEECSRAIGVEAAQTPAATEWYSNDAETVRLKELHDIYNNALSHATSAGYVGVGCISFAEAALQEAQV